MQFVLKKMRKLNKWRTNFKFKSIYRRWKISQSHVLRKKILANDGIRKMNHAIDNPSILYQVKFMINNSKVILLVQKYNHPHSFFYFKIGFLWGDHWLKSCILFEMQSFCPRMAENLCTVPYIHSKTLCIDKYFIVYSP